MTNKIEPIDKDPASDYAGNGRTMTEHGELLSLKQISFVNSLFLPQVLLDPAKAAEAAGYKGPKEAGERLMRNPAVRAEVEKRMARLSLASGLSAEAVLDKLWEEANNHDDGDSNPNARVSSLRTLAQHFNLIGQKDKGSEKKEAPTIVINVGGEKKSTPGDNAKVIDVESD